jgi:hypothetical protein
VEDADLGLVHAHGGGLAQHPLHLLLVRLLPRASSQLANRVEASLNNTLLDQEMANKTSTKASDK